MSDLIKVLTYSGADSQSLEHFDCAVGQLQCYIEDPVATIDRALAIAPDFVMAHLFKAYVHLIGTEPGDLAVAKACRDSASALASNHREQGHLAAVTALVNGHWHQAGRILEDVSIAYPGDILALQVGHLVDFFTGNAAMLRDRIARVLTQWSESQPGYSALLGMYAFGLEECGEYQRAEQLGRKAVDLNPREAWAQHAVAHVMEMQNRSVEGIAWMRGNAEHWSKDSFFQVHNWWHLALFHLELEEFDEVLSLYDTPIYGAQSPLIVDMIDASALLWRLQLLGIDVGNRWQAIADNWVPVACSGTYAFNDMHAAMAFAGCGRLQAIDDILAIQEDLMQRADDNAEFTRQVGYPMTSAIRAFAEQDYAGAIDLIRPVREISHRFGGSHAQRDLIKQTLIEAALRDGQTSLARALIAEREQARPESPLVHRMKYRLA